MSGDFRKKYDEAEWAQKAKEREQREYEERQARRDVKAGVRRREPSPPDARRIEARRERLNIEENVNKTTLVPAGVGMGRRGKGAGFYCDVCDETYKDSLSWVDHLNSVQHLRKSGQSLNQTRATLEEVRARLAWLRQKKHDALRASGQPINLTSRLAERQRIEAEERRVKREKKRQKEREAKEKREKEEAEKKGGGAMDVDDQEAMMRAMGFGGFGTTKV
ncbi:hypothetical protein G7K_6026-t1 [Saitoella complicata NRRL Y-17804]|uniref:C2H2-type domain-containing protein n=2 Tax=Saitoella complicata (strain BCRC 22490 / CBS 7301 / JCM 7358 / NBRC 10748 / NRRL Y-17804) TaxID=698492 RepID=A0A0E9NQ72_SAICN|nr:hypothetical protein G7K_6026-t1 [Saitoella complicata NRRL Y-17804]